MTGALYLCKDRLRTSKQYNGPRRLERNRWKYFFPLLSNNSTIKSSYQLPASVNMIWFWALLALPLAVSSLSYNRKVCQRPGNIALKGCPKNSLLVGPHGVHKSIQHAVLSISDNDEPYTIIIEPGNYTEQVNVTRQSPLTLLGMTASPNDKTNNLVNIIWHNATGAGIATFDNAYTSTLTIAPTLNASFTGTGPTGFPVSADTPFGNSDFRTYNLNFINDYLPWAAGPSLALSLSYANGGFYYSRFLSYQDTVSEIRPPFRPCR